jgi:hypothetical protein
MIFLECAAHTIDEDISSRPTEWHEGDVDKPQCLVDHLFFIQIQSNWSKMSVKDDS